MTPAQLAEMERTTNLVFRKFVEAQQLVELRGEEYRLAEVAAERAKNACDVADRELALAYEIMATHATNVIAGADALNPRTDGDSVEREVASQDARGRR